MKKFLFAILFPGILITSFISLCVFITRASSFDHYHISDDPYPPPPTPTSGPYFPGSIHLFLPELQKGWTYLSGINVPPYSMSNYVSDFGNNNEYLYDAGCELGTKVEELEGAQDFFVFLGFGQAYQFPNETYGVALVMSMAKKSLSDIKNGVYSYAEGFNNCSGTDNASHVTIGIGINNNSQNYTNYTHGYYWAEMVRETSLLLSSLQDQVSVIGSANIELNFNGPIPSRYWVNGYKAYMDNYGYPQYPLFVIGNAVGCPTISNNTDCGDVLFPSWTDEDVWYVNYGNDISQPFPMIYSHNWSEAEQWYMLSLYSAEHTSAGPMLFPGSFTQNLACQQTPSDPTCQYLDNTPEEGYKMLYTLLSSNSITDESLEALIYSSDISYIPIPQ